jgi:hypothetical protein
MVKTKATVFKPVPEDRNGGCAKTLTLPAQTWIVEAQNEAHEYEPAEIH